MLIMMKTKILHILTIFLLGLFPVLSFAQVTISSITGRVTATDGTILEGASIEAIHLPRVLYMAVHH